MACASLSLSTRALRGAMLCVRWRFAPGIAPSSRRFMPPAYLRDATDDASLRASLVSLDTPVDLTGCKCL